MLFSNYSKLYYYFNFSYFLKVRVERFPSKKSSRFLGGKTFLPRLGNRNWLCECRRERFPFTWFQFVLRRCRYRGLRVFYATPRGWLTPLNKPSQPLVYALRDSLQYLLRPSTVSVEQGSSNLASCLFRRFNEGSRIISVNYVHFVFIVSSINLIISKINLYNFTLVKKIKNLNLEIKYWIY